MTDKEDGIMEIRLNVNKDGKVRYYARTKGQVVGSDTREDTARWILGQGTPSRSEEFPGYPIAVEVNGTEYFFEGEWIGEEPKPRRKRRPKDIVCE